MASHARDKFIIEAHRLAHAAPVVWKDFEAAFAAYAAHQVEEAIKAPEVTAITAHGQARAYLALRSDFAGLDELFLQVERKLKTLKPR